MSQNELKIKCNTKCIIQNVSNLVIFFIAMQNLVLSFNAVESGAQDEKMALSALSGDMLILHFSKNIMPQSQRLLYHDISL